jgi:UDP-glucose:O-linked fucose beta-1,3-glucosyltransferase
LCISDPSIPGLVDLKVPNTDHGHCGKTEAIIKKVAEIMLEDPQLHWLLISDDDTILRCDKYSKRFWEIGVS